ncbi:MAG: DNA primase [Nitrosomonas sp.]|nr:DNA primase [Nitrosomonas sp.]
MIPPSFIHDLLNRINIVDAIDRHVSLKKAGANYIACCPFHSEKTPSFTVSPTKQFYHCFGCGAHGNAINFLMEYSGYSFVEAVEYLAAFVGMPMPELKAVPQQAVRKTSGEKTDGEPIITVQELYEAMRSVTQFYREQLKQSPKAIEYLKKRGLTGQTAARFAIGYAPEDWQNLSETFPDYHSEKTKHILLRTGLMVTNDNDKHYDRFRDRIMFPIVNQKGQIVAFGGRILEQGEPKYLNSPETEIFVKGQEIYNLFAARKAIRDAACVLVVEGYMDVVALSQHGIDYAVATLGTATTDVHIQKLLRYSDKVIFCFDGDNAGKKAARRALENSLAQLSDGKSIHFLFLPEGEDPDSFVRCHGKAVFEQQIMQALPLSEFLLSTLSQSLNLQNNEDRAKFIHEMKPLMQRITAPALTLILLKRIGQMCDLDQHDLTALLEISQTKASRVSKSTPRKQPMSLYRWLLLVLLHRPKFFSSLEKELILKCEGSDEELAALKFLVEFLDNRPDIVNDGGNFSILNHLQDMPFRTFLEKIESETLAWNDDYDLEAQFFGTMKKLQNIHRNKRMTELQNKPLSLLTDEEKSELQRLAMH